MRRLLSSLLLIASLLCANSIEAQNTSINSATSVAKKDAARRLFTVEGYYAEMADRLGRDSAVLVLYFKEPVDIAGIKYTRLTIFFSGAQGQVGYVDPGNKRIVSYRHQRDFAGYLAMLQLATSQKPVYGAFVHDKQMRLESLHVQLDRESTVVRKNAPIEPDAK